MAHKVIGKKEVLNESMSRLKNSKNLTDIVKNRKTLEEIRKDQKENGKYYSKESDNNYNPFKEFFKK